MWYNYNCQRGKGLKKERGKRVCIMYSMELTKKFAVLKIMMTHFTLLMLSAVMLATTPHNKIKKIKKVLTNETK